VPTEGNTAIVFRTGCKRQNLVVKENLFLPFYMKGLRKIFQGKVVGVDERVDRRGGGRVDER
jgi:hypothetical protein